ncbi:ComEC/Rec2 family competence protein [Brucella sp. BE17]|uniref:ComEC/Rec2 family competence protein n=1 Tax=Brucella sp. BE17 TaxID=3142977 RepID=UPI0031BBA57D
MTGTREAATASERMLVKSISGDLMRSRLVDARLTPQTDARSLPQIITNSPLSVRERAQLSLLGLTVIVYDALSLERARGVFFLLVPVLAGCGAVLYFAVPFEPDWTPVLAITSAIIIIRFFVWRQFLIAQLLTLALAFQLGIIAGKWETQHRATPMLGSDISTRITGRVTSLEYRDNGSWRVTLDVLHTERPKLKYVPERIRITARDIPATTTVGSGLSGFARLRVPSGPVRPGNYDFSFHAYFTGIGANGFFLGTPKLTPVAPETNLSARLSAWIALLRIQVSERVEEVIGGEDGNVAAALIAGTRGGISDETNEDLRKAGLAHILSISGLHMALAAGVVMLSLRSAFALFPAFSTRHPVKKYAAFLSLLSCTFYLAMSGADVAAQRSYVMIAVMLCALLADRAAISMRNLAIAGVAMIAISPHEVLGPSFQMSFSATAALIAAYAWWGARNAEKLSRHERRAAPAGWMRRFFAPAIATGATSLVAGLASGIFAAYHFNNTAPLGLLGNVLALPAISILVMPFAVFSLVLMPLGLDWLPLQIMGVGIWVVRQIAAFIALWSPDGNPGAMPVASLILWTIALILAVILTTRLKLLALPFVVAGTFAFISQPFPDIIISEDAKLVGVRMADGILALNRERPPKFTIQNWQTAYLIERFITPRNATEQSTDTKREFVCEEGLCTVELRDGRTLAYTAEHDMQDIACNVADVIILAVPGKTTHCPQVGKLVLNRRDLALKGTAEIRLGKPHFVSEASSMASTGNTAIPETLPVFKTAYADETVYSVGEPRRAWQLHRLYSRAARGLPDRLPYKKALSRNKDSHNAK